MVMSIPSVMTLYEYQITDDDDLDIGWTSVVTYLRKISPTTSKPNPANAIMHVQTASMIASMRRTASDISSSNHAITITRRISH